MKVYMVTSGEYSDYGVVALFTETELAEKYIADRTEGRYSDFNEIQEWEVYDHAIGEQTVWSGNWHPNRPMPKELDIWSFKVDEGSYPPQVLKNEDGYISVSGQPSKEKVTKILSDHIAFYRAKDEGIA